MGVIAVLLFLPLVSALLVSTNLPERLTYGVVALSTLVLSACALSVVILFDQPLLYHFSHLLEQFFIAFDLLLLIFFVTVGIRFRDNRVAVLAVIQIILYLIAEWRLGDFEGATIVVDQLSALMFTVINIVGGIIVLFAVRYMRDEAIDMSRRWRFIAYLLGFISIMNLLVIANSLLLFFFLFEMTTLASYLLIRFREDDVAQANALRALWMNQIGGVVILLGTLVAIEGFETIYIDTLVQSSGAYLMFGIALLSMAALVKGASMPFDSWLLGAMVAPTPVSAMLHSATMVKVAPFMILKFAPLLAGTLLGSVISLFGALVFVGASYLALSKEVFKEILGYSTIALLGLMMSLAAIGSEESMQIAMVLIVFHALSKALLFLSAGVIEKLHHAKSIESMKGLVQSAPKSVFFILFGFISLVLPPFGLFMGKLFALQVVSAGLLQTPSLLLVLIGIIIGSALLVLLYFKVVSALLSKESDVIEQTPERLGYGFGFPLAALSLLIIAASIVLIEFYGGKASYYMAIPVLLLAAVPWLYRWLNRFDRVSEYHCGERAAFDSALLYFDAATTTKAAIYWFFGVLFVLVALAGAVS